MDDERKGDEDLKVEKGLAASRARFDGKTDEELILLVQKGQNQAYDILVTRYKDRLYSYLYRMLGNGSEAEEFAQEAFVRAFIHADKYRTVAKFSTWLYTIATNLVRNRIRNIKRRPRMTSIWADEKGSENGRWIELRDESPTPEETMDRSRLGDLIQQAIEKIPLKYRNAFVLRELNGLSYEEIAATTGLKLGTVRSRINRGRMHFKKAVEPLLGNDSRFKGN